MVGHYVTLMCVTAQFVLELAAELGPFVTFFPSLFTSTHSTFNKHVYSPYRQKHTNTQDSTQIHEIQVHKKDKTEKNNQSVSGLTCSTYRPTRIMNTFIHQNGRERDRQFIQQTKQKRKNMHMQHC